MAAGLSQSGGIQLHYWKQGGGGGGGGGGGRRRRRRRVAPGNAHLVDDDCFVFVCLFVCLFVCCEVGSAATVDDSDGSCVGQ